MATPRSPEWKRTWTRQAGVTCPQLRSRTGGVLSPVPQAHPGQRAPTSQAPDQPGPRSEGSPAVAPSGKAVVLGWKRPQTYWLSLPPEANHTCRPSAPGAPIHPPFSLFLSTPPCRTRRLTLSPWLGPMPQSLPLTLSMWWPENAGSAARVPAPPLRTRISSGSGQKRSELLLLCTEANPETSDHQSSLSRQAQLPRTSSGQLGSPGTPGQRADG